MIRLYHGSNVAIEHIDLSRSKRGKDFGQGDVPAHTYDIVIGPIADDTVGVQIRRFIMGYLSASALVEELRFRGDHAVQYFFGTQKAVELLKRIEL